MDLYRISPSPSHSRSRPLSRGTGYGRRSLSTAAQATPLHAILGLLLGCLLGLSVFAGPAHADEPEAPAVDAKTAAKALVVAFKCERAAERQAAAEAAATNTESVLFTPLTKLLLDEDPRVRLAAFDALAARVGRERAKVSKHLVARLSKWEGTSRDDFVKALEVIGSIGDPSAAKPILDAIENDSDADAVAARFEALAQIAHADTVDRLIQFLARGRRGGLRQQRNQCVKALRQLTGERHGNDPDVWRRWWKEEGKHLDLASIKFAHDQAQNERAEATERKAKRRRERRAPEREAPEAPGAPESGQAP